MLKLNSFPNNIITNLENTNLISYSAETADQTHLKDLGNYFLSNRIVFISGQIEQDMANGIIAQILYLDSKSEESIWIYLSSYGGEIAAGLGICDILQFVKSKINIVCTSVAMSMGAVILACGDKRYALPSARIMIHQPLMTLSQHQTIKQSELAVHSREMTYLRTTLVELLSKKTKKTIEEIEFDLHEDTFMNATEALNYGLLDEIITFPDKNLNLKELIEEKQKLL